MKISARKIILCLLLVLLSFTCIADAAKMTLEEKRAELRNKVQSTLALCYEHYPEAKYTVENGVGYAVFANTGSHYGFFGNAHGRGMAINNQTGEEVFMKMSQLQLGVGVGIKEYSIVFVFTKPEAWQKFIESKWSVDKSYSADASDGVSGGSSDGAIHCGKGVLAYQFTTKGVALELSLGGIRYVKDKSYYPKEKKKK